MPRPLEQCRLYTFIDTAYLADRRPADVARQLCDGGSDLIQLRAKGFPPDAVRRMAEEILPVLRAADVGLVINDHWDIAREVGADYYHLGQEDYAERPPNRDDSTKPLLGLSTHAPGQALGAMAASPAYIAVGPVYATGTKPSAKPVGLEYVRWASKMVPMPWFAIGGIHAGNVGEILEAGATRICVVSAVLNSPNVAEACRQLKKRLS